MKFPLLSALLLSGGFVYAHNNDHNSRCANTVTRTVWNIRTRYVSSIDTPAMATLIPINVN
jgi:hypothetical protein